MGAVQKVTCLTGEEYFLHSSFYLIREKYLYVVCTSSLEERFQYENYFFDSPEVNN